MKYCIPDCALASYTAQNILAGIVHEKETIEYIKKNAGDGIVVHAGVGFGDFLPHLQNLPNTIMAFEPHKELYDACHKTIENFNIENVVLSNKALSFTEGSIFLKEDGIRSECSFWSGKMVEATTIDSIGKPISLIHLDVEGFEFSVLKGADETIRKYSPTVILEIDARAVTYNEFMKARYNYEPVAQLIHNAGPMVFVNTVYDYRP